MSDRNPFLTEAGTLANAAEAKIDADKVIAYPLDPTHPVGGHNARVFEWVLGYDRTNAAGLVEQILEGIRTTPAEPRGVTRDGAHFRVDLEVRGPTGARAPVRTGWVYRDGEPFPRLTTLVIRRRKRRG